MMTHVVLKHRVSASWMRAHFLWIAALVMLSGFSSAYAEVPGQPIRKDGLTIYYGVLPAEMVAQQEHGAGKHMQSTYAAGGDTHHLVVAIFEEQTGKRLSDASVRARVEPLGGASQEKLLEPMKIADTVTFGNFFRMEGDMPYVIHLRIRRNQGGPSDVEVALPYRHPSR